MTQLTKSRITEDLVTKRPDSPEMRAAIFRLEDHLKTLPQGDTEVTHRFTPGMYAREMTVPAGLMITGAVHKREHLSIFLEGKILIPDENGESIEITAPIVEIAKPGIKRVGYVIEPVRWITMHATDITDIDELEELLLTNDPKEAEIIIDQHDYASLEIPDEDIEKLKTIEYFPGDQDNVEIRESDRHGLGLFVKGLVPSGAIIAPAFANGKLMEYSRFTNHSANCNAIAVPCDDGVNLVAKRDIQDEEVTIDYRTSHRKGIELDGIIKEYQRGLVCHR